MILIYIFSINTLVHASTMGFFSHTDNKSTTAHCHEQQSSSPEKTQSMECCAFTLSNEYSHTNIEIKHIAYLGYMDNATIVDTNNIQLKNISPDRFLISKSP